MIQNASQALLVSKSRQQTGGGSKFTSKPRKGASLAPLGSTAKQFPDGFWDGPGSKARYWNYVGATKGLSHYDAIDHVLCEEELRRKEDEKQDQEAREKKEREDKRERESQEFRAMLEQDAQQKKEKKLKSLEKRKVEMEAPSSQMNISQIQPKNVIKEMNYQGTQYTGEVAKKQQILLPLLNISANKAKSKKTDLNMSLFEQKPLDTSAKMNESFEYTRNQSNSFIQETASRIREAAPKDRKDRREYSAQSKEAMMILRDSSAPHAEVLGRMDQHLTKKERLELEYYRAKEAVDSKFTQYKEHRFVMEESKEAFIEAKRKRQEAFDALKEHSVKSSKPNKPQPQPEAPGHEGAHQPQILASGFVPNRRGNFYETGNPKLPDRMEQKVNREVSKETGVETGKYAMHESTKAARELGEQVENLERKKELRREKTQKDRRTEFEVEGKKSVKKGRERSNHHAEGSHHASGGHHGV